VWLKINRKLHETPKLIWSMLHVKTRFRFVFVVTSYWSLCFLSIYCVPSTNTVVRVFSIYAGEMLWNSKCIYFHVLIRLMLGSKNTVLYMLIDNSNRADCFTIFFGGLECVGHSFAYVAHLYFWGFVWIRTQRAAVASRCAINLATHLLNRAEFY